jgi:hypothetical protein
MVMPTHRSLAKMHYWKKSKLEELANLEKVLLPVFLLLSLFTFSLCHLVDG